MSGGGEFVRDGHLWRMKGKMVVRLTPEEVKKFSTMRELLGVERLDIAVIPDACTKALLPLDSQATVACVKKGSGVPELRRVSQAIFLNQLRHNRVLHPVWMRRNEDIIKICDDASRETDNHGFVTASRLFWRANAVALRLWGRGFQVDAGADFHNAQPVDRRWRMPFYTRWLSPRSAGVDMLQQDWRGRVHWCNPPFSLAPRIIALLRAQKACAAVVLPLNNGAWWSGQIRMGAEGVLEVLKFDPASIKYRSEGVVVTYRSGYAVVFFDFAANPPSNAFCDEPSVESYPAGKGEVVYRHLGLH